MAATLIFNPAAGKLAQNNTASDLLQLARQRGCQVLETANLRRIGSYGQGMIDNASRIIVAGGDGTLHEAVNALADRLDQIELGLVPVGTGNDLARCLDVPFNDPLEALELALSGAARPADLGTMRPAAGGPTCYFINAAYGGLGEPVSEQVPPEAKDRWGALSYWAVVARKLLDLPEYDVECEIDGERVAHPLFAIGIANGRTIGGGFPIAPDALLDDGRLDVMLLPVQTLPEALAAGLALASGASEDGERLITYSARQIVVRAEPALEFTLDGEPQQPGDMIFEVLPGGLRLVCGQAPPAFKEKLAPSAAEG